MKNNIIDSLLQESSINKFFYSHTSLQKLYYSGEYIAIIQLDITPSLSKRIYQENKVFQKLCNDFLELYKLSTGKYYPNIAFGTIEYQKKSFHHCLILFHASTGWKGYRNLSQRIQIWERESQKDTSLFGKVLQLLKKKDISIRNLQKLGLTQKNARELYATLKEKWMFEISQQNNMEKIMHPENFHFLKKEEVEAYNSESV